MRARLIFDGAFARGESFEPIRDEGANASRVAIGGDSFHAARMRDLVAALLIVLPVCSGLRGAEDSPPPHILFIVIDDLRPMLACYGHPVVKTPQIDRLAREGLLFERACCQYAKCGTSRLSLMTGLRPESIGVFSNRLEDADAFRERRRDAVWMSRWFREAGYEALSFGKIDHDGWSRDSDWSAPVSPGREREMWEVTDPDDPRGPTRIADRHDCPVLQSPDVPDDHLYAGRMTSEVLDYLATGHDRPLFLAVGYRRPHLPFVAPKKWFDCYDPEAFVLVDSPEPPADVSPMAWFNSDGYVGAARLSGIEMPPRPTRDEAISLNGYELRSYNGVPKEGPIAAKRQHELIHAYAACVSYVDAQVGRLLDGLEAAGLRENTVVVLCSDHGWHLGEHAAWGKMTNYEIATRVPLIVSAPGLPRGRTAALAELVDLYPTLCDVAGIAPPGHLEGESLFPVLENPASKGTGTAHSSYARYRARFVGHAIRNDRFRYVRWIDRTTGDVQFEELYDHENDPHERRNLAGDPDYADDIGAMQNLVKPVRATP